MMQLWQWDSPRSWGTGQSVPGCRGITCSDRLRMSRKKEGRILGMKALCDIIGVSCAWPGPRMVLGWQKTAGVKGIFVKDAFIAPRLHRGEGAGAASGWETWDNVVGSELKVTPCTFRFSLWSPVHVSDPVPGHWQPAPPGLLSSKHCNVSSLGPVCAVLSCQKLQSWIFQSFLSGWTGEELDCNGRICIPSLQDGFSGCQPSVM